MVLRPIRDSNYLTPLPPPSARRGGDSFIQVNATPLSLGRGVGGEAFAHESISFAFPIADTN